MNKKLEVVDFLRGFAIFTIALMHLVQGNLIGTLNKAASFGGAGVHVFILASGFGLYLSYRNKPLGYGEFLKKRFGKVYWPYAVVVLLYGLWALLALGAFPMKEVASHLLLYKMFDAELDVSLCYPFWFISTIIQFYICWPLIVRILGVGGGQFNERIGSCDCYKHSMGNNSRHTGLRRLETMGQFLPAISVGVCPGNVAGR